MSNLKELEEEIAGLTNSDPITRFFLKRKIKPWKGGALILLINVVSSLLLALATNSFYPANGAKGFINDYPTWAFEFVLHPAIISTYIWLQHSVMGLFRELLVVERLIQPGLCLNAIKRCRKRFNSRLPYFLATLSGLLAGIITIYTFTSTEHPAWLTKHDLLGWSRGPIYFFIVYALTLGIYDVFATMETLNALFLNDIEIKFLHPDGVGGLGSIGRFVANLGYPLGAGALALTISVAEDIAKFISMEDYFLLVYIVGYLLVTPVIFVLPIYSAHVAMKKHKMRLLWELSKKVSYLTRRAIPLSPVNPTIKKITPQINYFEHVTRTVGALPTWPVNLDSFRKFFGLAISPLVPTILTFLVGLFVE